jgi:hypothetical protein
VISFILDPELNLAEGGRGKIAWPVAMWDKKTGKQRDMLGVNLFFDPVICQEIIIAVIPGKIEELAGNKIALLNRSNNYLYDQQGMRQENINKFRNINPDDYKGLSEIRTGSKMIVELDTDSQEFKKIVEIYLEERVSELDAARKYIHNKYGANVSRERLERLAYEDTIVRNFIEWAGDRWYAFISLPFDAYKSAIVMGIAKVIQLPGIFGDKLNKPGYMEYIPDTEHISGMILRGIDLKERSNLCLAQRAKKTGQVKLQETPLPDDVREALKKKYGREFRSYEEYNNWAAKF